MKKGAINPVIIRPDTNIGNSSAEADDEFLVNCFVDHPALASLRDEDSPKFFLSGRTGSGKTAILKMLQRGAPSSYSIDLHEMALNYVANSDIIRFLDALEVDLDLFFQALWKHVLCIEFIRMRYKVKNESASKGLYQSIKDFFTGNDRRKAALQYLQQWESRFWITMDENIKEVTQKLEQKVDAELGGEIEKFKARAGYAATLSNEKKAQIVARARKIVNADQLSDLNRVVDLLSEFDGDDKYAQSNYILIDRLDERWVDESIRYQLIRALIECLRSFRKIRRLKVIVAIRSDVLERVVLETSDAGFQREKYDDYFLRLIWRPAQIKQIVEKRINYLYRRKYTSSNVFFNDIFRHKVSGKDPFEYLLDRTLLRPRDIISFVNVCLSQAQGSAEVTARHIKEAESEYSRIRLQALVQECSGAFPSLKVAFSLLSGRNERFTLNDIATKEFIDEFILQVDQDTDVVHDPIVRNIKQYMKDGSAIRVLQIAQMLICELYRIGAVGLKLATTERYIYSHRDVPVVTAESIDNETKIHIHPMLHRALSVR